MDFDKIDDTKKPKTSIKKCIEIFGLISICNACNMADDFPSQQ